MQLSEAIMLGSTLIKWDGSHTLEHSEGGCSGCAIGMALAAKGYKNGYRSLLEKEWPWTSDLFNYPKRFGNSYSGAVWSIVSRMFFALERGEITLEQIVDWVRSVEPPEPEQITREQENVELAEICL